jgi:hypothetical protein
MPYSTHDLLPEIKAIIRDAIQDGLIRGVRLKTFMKRCETLKGPELEDYLQKLWDRFEPAYPKTRD